MSEEYGYDVENRLTNATSAAGHVNLFYDPLGRLRQMSGGPIADIQLQHDGIELTAEYRISSGLMSKRYVHGPGVDEPLVWYEGSGTSDRRFLHADERGSIVAISDASGNVLGKNTYDEFGRPGASNSGRFQYTGQAWLAEIAVQYSKARMYDPALGRFLQPDPIGYGAGPNLYAYVGNDPVNFTDPLGLCAEGEVAVVFTGSRIPRCVKIDDSDSSGGSGSDTSSRTTSGDGTFSGGPLGGSDMAGCNCIDFSDARWTSSVSSYGGLYVGGTWYSFGGTQLSSTMLHSAGSQNTRHDPMTVHRKVRDYIRRIQECSDRACSAQAWAEYDAYRESAEFQLEREENLDRQELVWSTVKGFFALGAGWGTSLLRVLGIWGAEEVADQAGRCAVRGGDC